MLALRFLLALKAVLEMHVWRTYGHGGSVGCEEDKAAVTTEESLLRTVKAQARPWRLSVDGTRAVLDLLIVGVGYLL